LKREKNSQLASSKLYNEDLKYSPSEQKHDSQLIDAFNPTPETALTVTRKVACWQCLKLFNLHNMITVAQK
jgi:hypothetical protein